MSSNRTRRILTRTLFVLCLSIGVFVFIFKERVTDVYNSTIQPTSFKNVVLEKDTAVHSKLPVKNLPLDPNISQNTPFFTAPDSPQPTPNKWTSKESTVAKASTKDASNIVHTSSRKGKEIKSQDIPDLHTYNSRIRLTTFLNKFKEGDYISGKEFSNLYRRDPSISKLAKGTICNFIEKNILQLTRNGTSFSIQTVDENGIHTKLKIPFVEDLRINIDNGAQVIIGETFTSKVPVFNKSILLPIQLKLIDILHNGEQFPTSGYISGDYYFIDYSKTKMAYKLR